MDIKNMTSINEMSQEQLAAIGAEVLEKRNAQKVKDAFYTDRAKHELLSLRKLVADNELETVSFPLTVQDYVGGDKFDFSTI